MEIRQLRYFMAVAEELHFGRAALRVNVAQPAVSQQIRQLENHLDVKLFDRTRHGVKLTEAGRALQTDASRILGLVAEAIENTRWASRGRTGNLTIGFTGSFLHAPLPALIGQFEQRFSDVSVKVVQLTYDELRDAIYADRIHLGSYHAWTSHFTGGMLTIGETPLMIAVPADHALAAQPAIKLRQASAVSFIFFSRAVLPGYGERIDAFCRAEGFIPNVVQDAISLPAALQFVATGRGLLVHPKNFGNLSMDGVTVRPLIAPALSVPTVAIWRPENTSSILATFLELLRSALSTDRDSSTEPAPSIHRERSALRVRGER